MRIVGRWSVIVILGLGNVVPITRGAELLAAPPEPAAKVPASPATLPSSQARSPAVQALMPASQTMISAPRACTAGVGDFERDVWTKVGAASCLSCHRKGGEAASSAFLLVDPATTEPLQRAAAMVANHSAFTRMALTREMVDGQSTSRLLLKATGRIDHGGDQVLAADGPGYRVLADFVRRVHSRVAPPSVGASATAHAPAAGAVAAAGAVGTGSDAPARSVDQPSHSATPSQTSASSQQTPPDPPFFAGVMMLDDRRLLRRATLSLCGRLPTESEVAAIAKDGQAALPALLDAMMREDAFYERLREAFNDIFLTLGVDGNADQTCLSYEHFEKTRHWYQRYDLTHIADKNERQRTEWKMAAEYRRALLGEPLKLIEHIVRNDRPFTEIVTADYIMVSPYSARGYGVFEQLEDQFRNPDDPFEYVPVKLKALVGRNRSEDQESASGFYPHAGLLSTFQYLTRYPTTETNRNRLRARMYYQHFLGVDVLELAARVSDAAAASQKYKVPTMEAAECVACHRTLDPVAGAFQDYWRFADQGVYGKRKGGWFDDMFAAGFEGEELPPAERWRALQWLGERTARDPRFAIAMVEHVYYILTGRKVLAPPKELTDPLFPARYRAYAELRTHSEMLAARFARHGFNLKDVFRGWIASDFYRADGLETSLTDPCRRAELEDIGLMRLLSPEQLERKVNAVFGEKWGRLQEQMATLYGGIDSKEVTDRATDPSGAMGAIQRTLSNDVACRHTNRDFTRPPTARVLFPFIEPTVLPGSSAEADRSIRQTALHLHERILGRFEASDSPDIDRTVRLFTDLVEEAARTPGIEKRESYYCRANRDQPGTTADDPHYTIRAWRAVVTYLLRRPEFLYE